MAQAPSSDLIGVQGTKLGFTPRASHSYALPHQMGEEMCSQPGALVQVVLSSQASALLGLWMPFACELTFGSASVSAVQRCVLSRLAGLLAAEWGVQLGLS